MKEKIAIPLEGHGNGPRAVVLLSDGGRMTRDQAKAKGYKIYGDPDAISDDESAVAQKDHSVWRTSVLALPEARDRESAAVEIVMTQTANTMPVPAARAFLRGLPTERTEERTTVTTNTDPRAARLSEIQGSMSAFNKNRGYSGTTMKAAPVRTDVEPAKLKRLTELKLVALEQNSRTDSQEYKILRNALDTHNRVGTPLNSALAQHGFDAANLLPKI